MIFAATNGDVFRQLRGLFTNDVERLSEKGVLVGLSMAVLYPEATDSEGVNLPDPVLEEELERSAKQTGKEVLDAEVQRVRSAGGTVARAHLKMGEVEREIVHLAEELGAGLIVMGSRGRRGMRRALMGSVSDSVVRHAHCPVMVVRH